MADPEGHHVMRLATAMRYSRLPNGERKQIQKLFRIMDVKDAYVSNYEDLAECLLGWSYGEIRHLERFTSPTEEILKTWSANGGMVAAGGGAGAAGGSGPGAGGGRGGAGGGRGGDVVSQLLEAVKGLKRYDVYDDLQDLVVSHCLKIQLKNGGGASSSTTQLHDPVGVLSNTLPPPPTHPAPPLTANPPNPLTNPNPEENDSGIFEPVDDPICPDTPLPDPEDEASCDTIMKKILETLDMYVSPRHEDALWFYCSLLLLALIGVVTSVRRLVRSVYSRPLDYSSVSLAFLALSRGKEAAFYLMAGGTLILLNEYALGDLLLMVLLMLMIFENKVVSPQVDVMRTHYIRLQEQPKAPLDRREKVQKLHRRIRKQLIGFLSVEILVTLVVWYLDHTYCDHHTERARVSIHTCVMMLCVSEILFTIVIFLRHYVRDDVRILKDRFATAVSPRV